jgi:signal transduction histidine kinase
VTGYSRPMTPPPAKRDRRSVLFDVMVAGFVAVLGGLPLFAQAPGHTAIAVTMSAALLWRRRRPLPVMAVISALGLLQVVLLRETIGPMPYDVAILIAMYSVVKYGSTLWHGVLAGAPVLVGIVIINTRMFVNVSSDSARPRDWLVGFGYISAICVAVWLTGYVIRTRRRHLVALEERAATAERERDHLATIAVADERASIARDLHDVVAHSMAVMIVQADGATYAMDSDPAQARAAIKQVAATGREALEDMRRLVGVLRGGGASVGDDGAHALESPADRRRIGLRELSTVVQRARSAGLTVTVDEQGVRDQLPAGVELTVYRVVQEALTNVLRHAGPSASARLCLRHADNVTHVELIDDGQGALAGFASPATAGGHGLVGMRERVSVHGGTFDAGARVGGGWRVAVTVPWT